MGVVPVDITTVSFASFYSGDDESQSLRDNYNEYTQEAWLLRRALSNSQSPLAWLLQEARQLRFLTLSEMAVDILTIPAMSADTERLFSQA
jgi:hypothetical protein